MLVQIGDNFVDPKIIDAVLADKPPTDIDTGREFESKPMSTIMLKNGTSFKDTRTPEEVLNHIDKCVLEHAIKSGVPFPGPDDDDHLSEQVSMERTAYALEDVVKQLKQVAESVKYLAEMQARLTMCVVDGQLKVAGGPQ